MTFNPTPPAPRPSGKAIDNILDEIYLLQGKAEDLALDLSRHPNLGDAGAKRKKLNMVIERHESLRGVLTYIETTMRRL